MKDDIYEAIQEKTQGRGADACIDAVGTEPDTMASWDSMVDRVKVATYQHPRSVPALRFHVIGIHLRLHRANSHPSRKGLASLLCERRRVQWPCRFRSTRP